MLRFIALLILVALISLGCASTETPSAEPEETPAENPVDETRGKEVATIGDAIVSIDYGRPQLQGRDMLGRLQDGQVWRLGMNEATRLETNQDLVFGETTVLAGKYSLSAKKVRAGEWLLIFNSEADIWGNARRPEYDVYEVPVTASRGSESVERFSIEITPSGDSGGVISMRWSTLVLNAPFVVAAPSAEGA